MEKIREYDESKIIKIRKEIAKKERNADMVDKIVKHIELLQAKYMKSVEPKDLDEVLRRVSMLQRSFIADCVENLSITLKNLKISLSSGILAARTIKIMELRIIVLPDIGTTNCVVVRERIADLISQTVEQIIAERVQNLKDAWTRREQRETDDDDEKLMSPSNKKNTVMVDNEPTKIIGKSQYSEFIGNLAKICGRRPSEYVSSYYCEFNIL